MNLPHMVDEEAMNKEDGEVDEVATPMVAEGEKEEMSMKEAGRMEGKEQEVSTTMVLTKIQASRAARGAQRFRAAFSPGHDPGDLGSSPTSGSLYGACFSLCLYLLSRSVSLMSK